MKVIEMVEIMLLQGVIIDQDQTGDSAAQEISWMITTSMITNIRFNQILIFGDCMQQHVKLPCLSLIMDFV